MSRIRLWIPENREIESPASQTIPLNIAFQGIFHIEKLNRSGEVTETWRFPNVITDALMDGIGSGTLGVIGPLANNTINRLRAGTGSAIPTTSDTNLQAPIGNFVTANGGFTDDTAFVSASVSGTYHRLIRSRLLDFNDCSGNITELAWFSNVNNTALIRSLVRDQFGTPTFISKTNDEQVRVRYEFRTIVPITTSSFQLIVGDTTHSVTLYPNAISGDSLSATTWGFTAQNFGGTSWTAFAAPRMYAFSSYSFAGGSWNPETAITVFNRTVDNVRSASAYTSGTYYRETSHSFAATNTIINAYPSGILAFGASPVINTAPSNPDIHNHLWMFVVDPPVQKSDIQSISFFLRWNWARTGTV